jgi:hypothetical protein
VYCIKFASKLMQKEWRASNPGRQPDKTGALPTTSMRNRHVTV